MSASSIEIIQSLNRAGLRKHTGERTFSFTEGIYYFVYNSHSTGRHLTISIKKENDSLTVYQLDDWDGSYARHNQGTVQGFQMEGPWVEQIKQLMVKFEAEIEEHSKQQEAAKAQRLAAEKAAQEARVKEFAEFAASYATP